MLLTRLDLVLPRARSVLVVVCMCALLILSGDVEQDGPDKIEKLQASFYRLLENAESYQKENSERLQSISNGVTVLNARVTQLESKVEEIRRSHDDIIAMKKDISSLETNLPELSSTCQDMGYIGDQVDALDNPLRRKNHMFKGIPEVCTWGDLESNRKACN